MPTFFCQDFPQFIYSFELNEMVAQPGIALAASTLGELIEALEAQHDIRVAAEPDSPKYFRYHHPASDPQ